MKLTSKLLKRLIKEELNKTNINEMPENFLEDVAEMLPYVMGGLVLPAIMAGAALDMGKFREEHGMEVANNISNLSEDEILMILPLFCFIILGKIDLVIKYIDLIFTSNEKSQSFSSHSKIVP